MQQRGTRLTILVAQQEEYERNRMVSLLKKGNVEILAARDGREALDLLRDHEPDILVTDVTLGDVDGMTIISRGLAVNPELKVVVAFGPYSPRLVIQTVEAGVDAFVRLPVDGSKLRQAVMKCARQIAMTRRTAEADFSLRQLLDFFPTPAVLADHVNVVYINRRMARFLGYQDHEAMGMVDMGLEDFITSVGDETYNGHPTNWLRDIVDDRLDRDHIVYIENPRHPEAKPNAFSVTHQQFPGSTMRLFTFQDISSLEDERVHLEDEASTDPLTRAQNRRSFLKQLGQAANSRDTCSLIMFDIDHFKSINDTYGHDVGDAVLCEISQLVRENMRGTDSLARWGGEEFMVLSRQTSMQRARRLAERLRHAVAEFLFTDVPRQITSSFGVAVLTTGETTDDLIKRVDLALYEAKETGRNRVVTSR